MEVETALIPLQMFEDFIRYQANNMGNPPNHKCTRLADWLKNNSLKELAIAHV